jgi:hypothetical protein
MTDTEIADLVRHVIRSELEPVLVELRTSGASEPDRGSGAALVSWLAAVPLDTTGSAAALLPAFLAAAPPPRLDGGTWTPQTFGRVLASIRDRHIQGRVLCRRADRKGVYVYTVEAVPPPAPALPVA